MFFEKKTHHNNIANIISFFGYSERCTKENDMMDFYYFSRQIDLWEEDLQEQIRILQAEKEHKKLKSRDYKRKEVFRKVYSRLLDGEIEICLN